jgi:hypothetical protein
MNKDPMISGAEFILLARAAGGKVASELGMVEVRTDDSGRFALIEWANPKRALALSMDAVQDYSVSARINRTDVPRPTRPPIDPSDFIGYDVTALLAHNGLAHAGLGEFGAGSRPEVEHALAAVMAEVQGIGMLLLLDSEAEWERLGNVMAERVRNFPGRPPGSL